LNRRGGDGFITPSGRHGSGPQMIAQLIERSETGVVDLASHELRNPRVADLGALGYVLPGAAPALKQFAHFHVEGLGGDCGVHVGSIAKFCGECKQHFAFSLWHPFDMGKPVNQIVSEALVYFMGDKWNPTTLGRRAGVSPNTVKNYREPQTREAGASGKAPSAKLTELELLANVLGLEVADLVTDQTNAERALVYRRRAAEFYARTGKLPEWAPDAQDVDSPPTVPADLDEHSVVLGRERPARKKEKKA
jgi:hypothetical protein